MIDLHNHVLPGVDDGASDLAQALDALAHMRDTGVEALVVTPHIRVSQFHDVGYRASVDAAWQELRAAAEVRFPSLRLERGFEVMLDAPSADFSDPTVRLAGTRYTLVEFPFMAVPPGAVEALFALRMNGVVPILAHPERYGNLDPDLAGAMEWHRVGAVLQVNAGSLLGKYGPQAERDAWRLLRSGAVELMGSDYHARGRCHTARAREVVSRAMGDEIADLLTRVNPGRVLDDEAVHPVGVRPPRKRSVFRRLFGGG